MEKKQRCISAVENQYKPFLTSEFCIDSVENSVIKFH